MAFEDILQSILGDEYTGTPSVFGGNNLWDDYSPSPTVPSVTYNEPSGIGGLLGNIFGGGSGDLGTTDVSFWDMMGDDWSLPVGSETGDDFTADDITYGDDYLSDFWGNMGDDWWTPVGSETGDPITGVNYGNTFLDDLLSGILQPGTYGTDTGTDWLEEFDMSTIPEKKGVDDPEDLTGWQKFIRGIIGSGSGPLGGSILGPQGEGNTQGVLGGLLSLLGIGGGGGILGGGAGEGAGLGGLFGSNPLMAFLMAKSLMKDEQTPGDIIPIGQQAFGGEGAYNMPDYRVTNLQPALMPGVGYANMAQPQQPTGMEQGGLAGLMGYQGGGRTVDPRAVGSAAMLRNRPQPVLQGYGGGGRGGPRPPRVPRGWKEGGITSLSEGPGDITLAKLEPGEFVMTRKATQNIGAKNLYDLMKRAEGRGG